MPVVISTSSIALQRAITQDYIPDISRILLESGFINRPLSCVIRKGKQHYLCDIRLEDYLPHADAAVKPALAGLLSGDAKLDLDEAELLSAYVKRKICVTDNCNSQCPKREDCRYLTFMKNAQTGRFDFQVCNHQYLLADLIRREQEAKPLIPNYQAVIIDEAHKLEQAAQGMYGTVFSNREIPAITRYIRTLTLADKKLTQYLPCYGDKLMALNNQLFMELCGGLPASGFFNDETERFQALYTDKAKTLIRSLRHALDTLRERLDVTDTDSSVVSSRQENLYAYILYALKRLSERLKVFQSPGEIIYWLEIPKLTRKVTSEISFCNIPKKLGRFLYRDLWTKRFPVLLTSGTLAAGGSFFHAKKRLGLELIVKERVTETVKPSPFNYEKNCLLYISEDVPYPDNQSHEYIESVSEEIERLINASRGHAAVLFTSYRVMEAVYQMIEGRELGYPLFKLNRNDNGIIGQFKESGNGVLFASGSLWEGIDLPGDILSMLVIVKLPFQVPDPLSEYEQSLYNDEADYKRFVVLPDMLLKLKQGFGRLIRREDDTGVVAILDYRVRIEGTYREAVLQALPKCRVTDSVKTVEQFICHMKSDKYFSGGSDYGV
jgi:ATP-dependent DNA helicase DinG